MERGGVVLFGVRTPDSKGAAGRLLAWAAKESWGWTSLPRVAWGENGKPYFPAFPTRQFSLSHTKGLCLCALSEAGPVGVDAELIRPRRRSLPRYVLSDREWTAFDGTWEHFYHFWTLKEAYCKYLGRGIYPPKEIPVPPPVEFCTFGGEGWQGALCGGVARPVWVEGRL